MGDKVNSLPYPSFLCIIINMQLPEEKIGLIITGAIERKIFPGAVFAITQGDKIIYNKAFGHFTYDPQSSVVAGDTMYDIASVTKQIVATGVLKLIELKKIGLNELIRKYLPIPDVSPIGDRTIWHLLTHTSNIQVETSKLSKEELTDVLYGNLPDSVLVQEPGMKVHYGNINTYLLGEIISKVSGKSLSVFLREEIFNPLDMEHTMYCPPTKFQSQIPPTEILSDGSIIKGVVHDEGARMLGGEVGQAGLFSNVSDLTKFIMFWTNNFSDSQVLREETIELAVKNHTPGMNLAAGLGWHLDDKIYLGSSFEPDTFFHSGFTGTIIGGNRKTSTGFVFLSNCTYPHREGNKLKNEIFQSILTETFLSLSA